MAILYRGAGPGSYWHANDARKLGFYPHVADAVPSTRVAQHIARASTSSTYISLTRSFGVARAYAEVGSSEFASIEKPGYVHELEISDDKICRLLDPVKEIAKHLPEPFVNHHYYDDGAPEFLLGVVAPESMK